MERLTKGKPFFFGDSEDSGGSLSSSTEIEKFIDPSLWHLTPLRERPRPGDPRGINGLPPEILHHIDSLLDGPTRVSLRNSTSSIYESLGVSFRQDGAIYRLKAHDLTDLNHFELLKWARKSGCPWDRRASTAAAERGDLRTLKWLRDSEEHGFDICPWGQETVRAAVRSGSIPTLEWMMGNGGILSPRLSHDAAKTRQFNMIRYLHTHGICRSWEFHRHLSQQDITPDSLAFFIWAAKRALWHREVFVLLLHEYAVREKDIALVQWLLEEEMLDSVLYLQAISRVGELDWVEKPFFEAPKKMRFYDLTREEKMNVFLNFIQRNRLEDLKSLWAYIPLRKNNKQLLFSALKYGSLETIEWIRDIQDTPSSSDTMPERIAISRGDVEVLEWLQRNGFPRSSSCYTNAIQDGQLGVLSWLITHPHPKPEGNYHADTDLIKKSLHLISWGGAECQIAAKNGNWPLLSLLRSSSLDTLPVWRMTREAAFMNDAVALLSSQPPAPWSGTLSEILCSIKLGSLDEIRWVYKNTIENCDYLGMENVEITKERLWAAVGARGSVDIANWLLGCCSWHSSMCNHAAIKGAQELLEWANGKKFSYDVFLCLELAVRDEHYFIAQYILSQKTPRLLGNTHVPGMCDIAVEKGNLDILKLLLHNHVYISHQSIKTALRKRRTNIFHYLIEKFPHWVPICDLERCLHLARSHDDGASIKTLMGYKSLH